MTTSISPKDFFSSLSLESLKKEKSIEKISLFLRLILLIICAILLFYIFQSIFSYLNVGTEAINKMETQVKNKVNFLRNSESQNNKEIDYSIITNTQIIEIGKAKAASPVKPDKPISKIALNLIGTFLSGGIGEPYAIIEDSKKREQEVFLVGDKIFEEDATVEKIFSDRVEIKRNGEVEILIFDEKSSSGEREGGTNTEGETIGVDENELNKALDNLPLLLTQARAVPYFKDGKSIGLRMFAIKRGSLYEKIGIKNGDILKSINGNNLGDITQAVKLFEKLKKERKIELELDRNRSPKKIFYEIK